jgi:hypothetical protein
VIPIWIPILVVVLLIIVVEADCYCYSLAKYPERTQMKPLPGAGFIALYRYGRDS